MEEGESSSCIRDDSYLIPELLDSSRLVEILETKCVKTNRNLHALCKDELVVLFHKYVTPLPQRIWRENRRGKKILKERQKDDKFTGDNNVRLKPAPASQQSTVNYEKRENKFNRSNTPKYSGRFIDQKRKPGDIINYHEAKKKRRDISWP